MNYGMETIKWQTRATYGFMAASQSPCAGLGFGISWMQVVSVTHSAYRAACVLWCYTSAEPGPYGTP